MNSLKDIFTDVLLNFSLQSKTQIWKEQRVTVTLLYFILNVLNLILNNSIMLIVFERTYIT